MSGRSLEILARVPRLIRNCRLSESSQEKLLLMPEGVLKLKGAGAAIVELCDGKRTVSEIIETLKARYASTHASGADQIESEALEFFEKLREKRVVDL